MDFRDQIVEDIRFYQEAYPNVQGIDKEEWAFNFWILDKLFCEDESEIENKILEYSDNGVDCFVWHEELKDLYLIQNKFYREDSSSKLDATYFNKAIEDGYSQLKNGNYKRSEELQRIFNKYAQDPDFYVYHNFYVTNEKRSSEVEKAVEAFNVRNRENRRFAQVFYLDDIREAYYGEPITDDKTLSLEIYTLNDSTTLKVNNEAYKLNLPIDAIYIMLPVVTLHNALIEAEKEGYPIFDLNIREYLGVGKAVNKGICQTLISAEDRKRFFFYNNGITIICDNVKSDTRTSASRKYLRRVTLENPQIVNGCQTVSSIKHVLDSFPTDSLEEEFKDTFVMAKILQIPKENEDTEEMDNLRESIVRYNNSQNSIDQKTFTAVESKFQRIQREFADYGFLLALKQSDKEKYKQQYKKPTELINKAEKEILRFGLKDQMTKTTDFIIELEKLLQVILAFSGDSYQAFQKKGSLLDKSSSQYKLVSEKIESDELTTRTLLNLYLLYLKSEKLKKAKDAEKQIPITWYLIESFSAIECQGGDFGLVNQVLSTSDDIEKLVDLYEKVTRSYLKRYMKRNAGKAYNNMIKERLDLEQIRDDRDIFQD